ncbi:hypothetical protein [Streptomyces eurythermus]|uniref:hypothetical protein n=1 Tax=Streptomyces eurythermus TaxID=42237 RepID=UPI0016726628|nr:hypothetical protein [Streptomyces eurythermus]MBK3520185.1 hypothetical protein [Streptomyces sp. MBT70]
MPVHDLSTALVRLALWLALAASAWRFAALAAARLGPARPPTASTSAKARKRHLRANGLLATCLFAQLLLIVAGAARDDLAVEAGAGGLMLALVSFATWHAIRIGVTYGNGFTPSDSFRTVGAFALTGLCGVWLTVRGAARGPLWLAWLVGVLSVLLAALFWLLDDRNASEAERANFLMFASTAAAGVLGVVIDAFARDVNVPVPVLLGSVPALLLSAAVTGVLWRLRGRPLDTGPPGAQLAGLVVPLGSVLWAAWKWWEWDDATLIVWVRVSGLVVSAALLLVLQTVVLGWLDTTLAPSRVATLVRAVRDTAQRVADERDDIARSTYRFPDAHAYERERAYREREVRERERRFLDQQLGHAKLIPAHGGGTTLRHLLSHPLLSPGVAAVHRDTTLRTGLAIDKMWPRVEVIAPPAIRQRVRRSERRVLIWRLIAASALCTAAVWAVVAYLTATHSGRADDALDPALLAVLVGVGPLPPAVFAVVQARRQLIESTMAKAQAVDVLRYDLARTMQLELPEDTHSMILLAHALSGDRLPDSPPVRLRHRRTVAEPGGRPATDPTDLDRLRRDIREEVRREVRSALRDASETLLPRSPAPVTLQEEHLSRLARDTAEPIGNRLKDQLTELVQSLRREMGAVVRTSLDETVTGPPLTNFLGYLAIEPDRRAENTEPPLRAERGTLKATAGGRISLMLSVVRDRRAQNTAALVAAGAGKEFFVYEPIRIEGGQEAGSVPFEAMVDSSTLTPLPQRKSLSVAHEVQTPFGFRLPEQPGTHEVWFQLYQAGRLIQVTALRIEAEAAPEPPAASETSGTRGKDAPGR